jgi:hypothetical protein
VQRVVLADHAQPQLVLHREQLLLLALQHLGDRDAGPLGDDLRDLLRGHLLGEQRALGLERRQALGDIVQEEPDGLPQEFRVPPQPLEHIGRGARPERVRGGGQLHRSRSGSQRGARAP